MYLINISVAAIHCHLRGGVGGNLVCPSMGDGEVPAKERGFDTCASLCWFGLALEVCSAGALKSFMKAHSTDCG